MFRYTLMLVVAIILLTPVPLWCGDNPVVGVPTMKEVIPAVATPGTVVLVTGENLDRLHVAEVYLTKGTNDVKVQLIAQAKAELKFKVPAEVEVGRYGITLLTTGTTPMLLDQPVYLTVKRETETRN